MLSWSWTPNLFIVIWSLLSASTLILSTCRFGLVGGHWAGWVGVFCFFVLFVCLFVIMGLWYGAGGFATCCKWNFRGVRWLEYFWCIFLCSMVQLFACLSGLEESHPLGESDFCFWLFQANSLRQIFKIVFLCNVLLLLIFDVFSRMCK